MDFKNRVPVVHYLVVLLSLSAITLGVLAMVLAVTG